MVLIKQIQEAIQTGNIPPIFTTQHIKKWVKLKNIVKDDGEKYEESSINSILSNSDVNNSPTTNNNTKLIQSKLNNDGVKEYWFL